MESAAAPHPPVRLTPEEVAAVKRIVAAHFGPAAEVRVFGSRTRLDVLGGDLDLVVHVPGPGPAPGLRAEGEAVWDLEDALDGLPVDLVVVTDERPPSRFELAALRDGVPL